MNPDKIKLVACIIVGLIGFNMAISRDSILIIIVGFLLVAAAVVVGTLYQTKLRQPRNTMQNEIDALLARNKEDKNNDR